jgi:murein DD-endopeptidase MepM/ murein hydrolase activator NlpD
MAKYKYFILIFLLIISIVSWERNIRLYKENKSEIIIQLAELLDRIALPYRIAELAALPPEEKIFIPIRGISLSDIEDTFGDPRPNSRDHEGIDIFASKGTPVYSAAAGYVVRVGRDGLGGNYVLTIGKGGRRYYYAHLDRFAEDIKVGKEISTDTILGYVGNTGNASTTPPHLHFGMYAREPINPYHLFIVNEKSDE